MFKTTVGCLVATLILLATAVTARASEEHSRVRLGCVPFLATSLQAMAFTENISASLLNGIDRSCSLEVVERRKIEQVLELEGLRLDNLDQQGIARIGAKAGLDYVIHGSVSTTGTGATIDVSLLNVRSNRQVMRNSYAVSESDYYRRVQEIAAAIVERVRNGASPVTSSPAAPPPPALQPPTNVTASGSTSSIRLSWSHDDAARIAGFNIYRSGAQNGPFSLHATATVPQFTDENLRLNEVYYYRVATVSQSGNTGEQSTVVRGETSVAPAPPIFMNVEADVRGARLAWRPRPVMDSDPRTTPRGYRIYRRPCEGGEQIKVADLPAESLSWDDSGLAEGARYVYTLTSYNRQGAESDFSARLGVTPLASPSSPRAHQGAERQVALSWDRYASELVRGYVIYRATARDGAYAPIARVDGPDSTSYIDREPGGATYWYRLSAVNGGGAETAPSEPVSAIIAAPPQPAPSSHIPAAREVHAEMSNGQSK